MKSRWLLVLVIGACSSFAQVAQAEEKPARSRIVSAGLFKNGLAVMQREVVVPGPGLYRMDGMLQPVHGTYWVEGEGTAETRMEQREIEVPVNADPSGNLQKELAGQRVRVRLRDVKGEPIEGTVVKLTK